MYTHRRRGKTEKGQSQEYFKIFGKNTIFNEHPVVDGCRCEDNSCGGGYEIDGCGWFLERLKVLVIVMFFIVVVVKMVKGSMVTAVLTFEY